MSEEDFRSLAFYNAESGAILQALEAHGKDLDMRKISASPCVVPERNVDDQTYQAALAKQRELSSRPTSPKVAEPEVGEPKAAAPSTPRPPRPAAPKSGSGKPWWKFW
jgi:hypothetical protein